MSEIDHFLSKIEPNETIAAKQLLPLVYDELRRLAAAKLAMEQPGQTLQATALVHEVYLRLVGGSFSDDQHFIRVAAEAMRQILIDRARWKQRLRHGGEHHRIPISSVDPASELYPEELLALNESLERFSIVEPVKAELLKLRYFAGLSEEEAAAALGISRATASRYWSYARAWLIQDLKSDDE